MNKTKEKNAALVAIGTKIRAFRKEKGFSQDEAAASFKLSRSYYSAIERGEHNFSLIHFVEMCRSLKVSPTSLLELPSRRCFNYDNKLFDKINEKHSTIMQIIGNRIRIVRKERGFSDQESLAKCVNLTRAYYSSIERGEYNLSVLNFVKIYQVLNVNPGCLFPNLIS